jgi:hypothetical protein
LEDSSRIIYPEVRPGVHLVYELTGGGVKEQVVVSRPPPAGLAPLRFTLSLQGVQAQSDGYGSVVFLNESGLEEARIPPGVAIDAAGATTPVGLALEVSGAVTAVALEVDQAWLADPARAYPIAIDPTFRASARRANVLVRPDAVVAEPLWWSPTGHPPR